LKFAVLSDIHANLEAFESVLLHLREQKCEKIIFLGDWVGYGPNPCECIRKGQELSHLISLAGNHDWAVVNKTDPVTFNIVARQSLGWTQKQLGENETEFLKSLPVTHIIDNLLFVHSTPDAPTLWKYIITRKHAEHGFHVMQKKGVSVAFVGHTHFSGYFTQYKGNITFTPTPQQVSLSPEARYIINVGSVGQPRDHNPKACYGIYNTEASSFTYYRIPYPLEAVQNKIIDASLHPFLAVRIAKGV